MDFEDIIKSPERLRDRVLERLEREPVDFAEQLCFVRKKKAEDGKWSESGVLVPLEFNRAIGEYCVVLNKRSVYVQQAGDLCFPGGGTEPRLDRFLATFLAWRILPTAGSTAFRHLMKLPREEKEAMLFVFAGVLRESWEEMGLKSWKVEYLGALPTYQMHDFRRVVFPIVGRLRPGWEGRPNWEVEKVLRLPLGRFFQPENYVMYRLALPQSGKEEPGAAFWEMPGLAFHDKEEEEVLWGLTFRIIMGFLERVFGLPLDQIHPTRRIEKELPPYYFSGKARGQGQES